MPKIFLSILTILFISILFWPQVVSAIEPVCEWELPRKNIVELGEIRIEENKKFFTNVKTQSQPIEINCFLTKPVSLQNQLINFEFLIKTSEKYDMTLSLIDTNGNVISTSSPLLEWYEIFPEKKANVVLDPFDFGIVDPSLLTGTDIDYENKIGNFRLKIFTNDIESMSISYPEIISIKDHPDFEIDEHLPIQSVIPGFLGLILLSFPIGFVLLNNARFLKEVNFFVKVPWFLGFGFCIYVVFMFFISQFWISLEIILVYLVITFFILFLYIKKNKTSYFIIPNLKFDKSLVFFSVILIISATLSINYVEQIAWPTGIWDSLVHVPIISLSVENHVIDDLQSFLPIRDVPGPGAFASIAYPTGSHIAAAGLSFLTERFPAVAMESVFSFTIFLIPLMLASFVYRFTKSIFLSGIMFMVTYWQPIDWYAGDMMLSKIITSNFSAETSFIALLCSFMIFVEYFKNENKLKLFIYFVLTVVATALLYYGFVVLPILIGIAGFLIYHLKSKRKKVVVFAFLIAIFISMPLWTFTLHNMAGLEQQIPYIYPRYASHHLFDPYHELFPFWISTAFGITFASYLLIKNQYRYFSIIVLFTSIIHLLAFSHDLALNYTFFYKAHRSVGLMFLLSVLMNLIMINFLSKRFSFKPTGYFTKFFQKNIFKVVIISILFLVLHQGFHILDDRKEILMEYRGYNVAASLDLIPSGNERNLQFWLYENTNPDDLILNDLTSASEWLVGYRAQNLINGHRQSWAIGISYNDDIGGFDPIYQGAKETLRANEILRHPWDYQIIEEIVQELDIKYIYISEREKFEHRCALETKRSACYPTAISWSWKQFSGDARVAMYEEHPNLDLILRNGNSAIFKVVR